MLIMEFSPHVQSAIERIQQAIPAQGDETLLAAWLDWCLSRQMQPEGLPSGDSHGEIAARLQHNDNTMAAQ